MTARYEDSLKRQLVAAVVKYNDGEPSYDLEEIADVAIRRWSTFERRHPKTKRVNYHDRVNDLAKGLKAHFEPNVPFTHPTEWRLLSEALADALTKAAGSTD